MTLKLLFGDGGGVRDDELYTTCIPSVEKSCFRGKEVQSYFLPNLISSDPKSGKSLNLHMSAWSSMYSMELIQRTNWRFISEREIIAEDVYSLLDIYSDVQCVSVVQDYLYFYCVNESSLTKVYRPERYWKIKKFYKESVELCRRKGYDQYIIERVHGPYLAFTIAALKQESEHKAFGNSNIRNIINDDVFYATIVKHREKNFKKGIFYWAAKRKYMGLCELILMLQTKR